MTYRSYFHYWFVLTIVGLILNIIASILVAVFTWWGADQLMKDIGDTKKDLHRSGRIAIYVLCALFGLFSIIGFVACYVGYKRCFNYMNGRNTTYQILLMIFFILFFLALLFWAVMAIFFGYGAISAKYVRARKADNINAQDLSYYGIKATLNTADKTLEREYIAGILTTLFAFFYVIGFFFMAMGCVFFYGALKLETWYVALMHSTYWSRAQKLDTYGRSHYRYDDTVIRYRY